MNIQLLLTGNELMNGDIVDSNSAMIAQQLLELGLTIKTKVTIGDDLSLLVEQLQTLSASADILIVNGGLGPTRDDMTAEALAQLTATSLTEHPQALKHLTQWCRNRGSQLNNANLKQVMLPEGSGIIPNNRGSAVGIRLNHNHCQILCTPGVPSELKAMLEQTIIPELGTQSPREKSLLLSRFQTFGIGESGLQQWIDEQFPDWPEEVELGFRAGVPTLEVKLQTQIQYSDQHEKWCHKLQELIGDYIVSEGSQSLSQAVVKTLSQLKKKVTTAESCTGGLIASMLTQVPGSSSVFEAGYVTYANSAKMKMVGVKEEDLKRYGAVSETVVRQMAQGALERSGADFTIAVSGVAGPDGGSDEKPVGLVWLAWGDHSEIHSTSLYFPYGRGMFQAMVAGAGLDLIRRIACEIEGTPRYITERKPPQLLSKQT
ncbi:CinA family nicotinamide mononucleotide deamidase-related protein [Motiliproteus sp. MSK22-1]|uniref:CinA family nicotinamide mononucleotide deamidase-related protein n=1 Tax=Motiliproteus sp. MSK22-1 TaxID=1897630 RepID=UPI00097693E3|nr:CinA family nicotinamide mononucleotide deamidase-related protein [Motiliproteus sp. MSK22-1]OMH38839.1 damage-inducible protein CinA [Motiliproteus sp. MSK22-1]